MHLFIIKQEQLHARCPLYTKRLQMISDPKRQRKVNKVNQYRLQYKLRNEMFDALSEIRQCRDDGKLNKLIKIADYELGTRYRVHAPELIPRRDEFTVDICNYIALAHIDVITKLPIESVISSSENNDNAKLTKIFNIDVRNKHVVHYKFGVYSTYRDPAEPDTSFLTFKQNTALLEQRLNQRSVLVIEQCHLLHEMGRENLKQQRADEARNYGKKVVESADGVSHLWMFLGHMMVCRADVLQKKHDKVKETLIDAIGLVHVFKSDKLKHVLDATMKVEIA